MTVTRATRVRPVEHRGRLPRHRRERLDRGKGLLGLENEAEQGGGSVELDQVDARFRETVGDFRHDARTLPTSGDPKPQEPQVTEHRERPVPASRSGRRNGRHHVRIVERASP